CWSARASSQSAKTHSAGRAHSRPRRSMRRWPGSRSTAKFGSTITSASMRCSTNSNLSAPKAPPKRSAARANHKYGRETPMPAPAQVTLPSDREVRVTRQFNAPRQLVYDAHTKPELIRKWLGYADWDMPVCEMDVRVGGKYR